MIDARVTELDDDGPIPRIPAWVYLLVLATVVVAGALVLRIVDSSRGALPPFLAEGYQGAPAHERPQVKDALVLAGSGSNLPLTRELAGGFAQRGGVPPVVHASIGSGGGIRALIDGAIDIALVSRPLKAEERAQGLVAVPYARAPVIVGVHTSVPETGIMRDRLLEIYAGQIATWDDGTRLVVLQREQGDSSHAAIARVLPEFARIDADAYQSKRWRVIYNDAAMEEALASTEGGIGLLGSGRIEPSLAIRALDIDDVEPTVEHLEDGSYPFSKDLAFVTRGEPDERAAAFIRFTLSPAGRELVRGRGCMPLGGQGPALGGGS